ncbi:MAG: hypothetical protein H7Z10_12150, partial [Gemmatimonadaceae bacterium]|nr:hypothetical protein [Acetobacteraceae bacterium]
CASQDKSVVNDCTSYITGVSDSISFYQSLRPADGSKGQRLPTYICMPTEVTGVKQREAVVAWLKKKPDDSRRQAVGVVANAFADAFPCR